MPMKMPIYYKFNFAKIEKKLRRVLNTTLHDVLYLQKPSLF